MTPLQRRVLDPGSQPALGQAFPEWHGVVNECPLLEKTPKAFLKHLRALGLQLWHFDLFLTTKGRRVGRLASPERKVPPIRFCKKLHLPPTPPHFPPFYP